MLDELSAKVAQLQAALAEVDNVGVMENVWTDVRLARLEEGYSRDTGKGFDEDGAAAKKQPSVVKAAAGPQTLSPTRQKKLMLKTGGLGLGSGAGVDAGADTSEAAAEAAVAPAIAPPTAAMLAPRVAPGPAAPRPRGRPRGSLNRKTIVKQAAAAAQANTATAPPPSIPTSTTTSVDPIAAPKKAGRPKAKGGRGRHSTDSMKAYLKDIGSITLLTAEQEVELAKRIQDLMYLDDVKAALVVELGQDPSSFEWAIAAKISQHELVAGPHRQCLFISTCLVAHVVTVHPYTLAASSSLAWPLVP